jgi:tetratricopeptide (TPR) repeat protein
MFLRNLRPFVLTVIVALSIASCSLFDDVTYVVTPNPLEAHGDSVKVTITGTVPEKSINKSAIADVTPVLRWEGGEVALKTVTVQGEKAAGNGTVISSKTGGNFNYSDVVAYNPSMMKSELFATASAGKGTKRKELGETKIADGVNSTPYLVEMDYKPIMGKDAFQRIITERSNATINYLVNSPVVRASELKDIDMKEWDKLLKDIAANERLEAKKVDIEAFASPEGEVDRNDKLATSRSGSAKKANDDLMKKSKVPSLGGSYTDKGLGEDWAGFRKLLEASSIEDKALIIRILETYSDVNQREKEMKNLSKTYTEIADQILPKLRRAEMVLSYDVIGYSDEELVTMSKADPSTLKLEELLYAAQLHSDEATQLSVYKNAEGRFTDDYRAANNIGAIYFAQGKMTEAEAQFKKAANIQKNATTSNNTGIFMHKAGERKKSAEAFREGMSAGTEAAYNLGIVNIQDGAYDRAVSNFKGYDSVNSALAALLNGDAATASNILDRSDESDSAKAHYLRAVIAARGKDAAGMNSHLREAVAKDPSLKARAEKDAEFLGMTVTF